jgi:hypothetical protein
VMNDSAAMTTRPPSRMPSRMPSRTSRRLARAGRVRQPRLRG